MKEFKGTPGPWLILEEDVDKPYIRIRGTRLGGRYKVSNVLTPVYEGVPDREAQETRANANLIAAAPELLSVLQKIVESDCVLPNLKIESRWAIAKALGESQ